MKRLWLDFESRSLLNLKNVGLDNYARHPSTFVLMLAWAVDLGEVNLWQPHLGPMPEELKTLLLDKTVTKCAWNFQFEKHIFEYVLGIPTDLGEWYDSSVLAAYMSLPIGLGKAGDALAIMGKKIPMAPDEGVKFFSVPKKATKKMLANGSPALYFKDWDSNPDKWESFCTYCKQDVIAEREIHYALTAINSPMTDGEIAAWELDQRMNSTGVYIDQPFVRSGKKLAEAEANQLLAQMGGLTHCENPNSGSQLKEWLAPRGYPFDSLDVEHIEEALKLDFMTPEVRLLLELKQKLGGSAYKKFQSIEDRISTDGRLRWQFLYHGAHTGRWAGRGVQLQNLYKPDKAASKLAKVIIDAIRSETLVSGTCPGIDVMTAIASVIRTSFCATPGHKLVVGDLAQIESRVLAALSGCQAMINAYAQGHDLYIEFMSWMLSKELTKKDNPDERNIGKVVILGCFGEKTPVLTQRGWVPITKVTLRDRVFDGFEWVLHSGVVAKGRKPVIDLNGIKVTPDHKIEIAPDTWRTACQLKENTQYVKQATSLAIGRLSNIVPNKTKTIIEKIIIGVVAKVVGWKNWCMGIVLNQAKHTHVSPVQTQKSELNGEAFISFFNTSPENMWIDSLTDITPSHQGVVQRDILATGSGEFVANSQMSTTLSDMSQPLRAGTIQNWKLIDGIMTETIQEEISGSSPVPSIYETEVETFDVVNAGPRSRYMIRTAIGPMIVHNSGFGMGVDKFVDYCATFGIIMPRSSEDPNEVTAERCIYGFREKYAEIPVYWKALENAVKSAVREHRCIYVKGVVVDGRNTKCLRIKLPSGRYIHYFNPKIGKKLKFGKMMETVSYTAFDAKGSQEKDLYGGLVTENVVQAVARDILLNGMLEAEKMGFRITMTVHDEIVAEVLIDSPLGEAQLLACMTKTPEWAEGMGFILGAEGYENPFYKK